MEHKLLIEKDTNLDDLHHLIKSGYKFISFQYCISIMFAVTLRRFSPAILIHDNKALRNHKYKYNLLTLLFGWWGFPWGPIYSIRALNVNQKGGIDVTDDVMLNITSDSLKNRVVELKTTQQLFCKPDKWDIKSFKIAFFKEFENDVYIKKIVVGRYINTEEGIPPYYIGLNVREDFESQCERVRKAAFTQFRKRTHFEFVNLNEPTEISGLLEGQGETIIQK